MQTRHVVLGLGLVGCSGDKGMASVDFGMGQMRTEATADGGSAARERSRSVFPEVFEVPVYDVFLYGDGEDGVLYEGGGAYIDLAAGAEAASAALTVDASAVPAGTYRGLSIRLQDPQTGEAPLPRVAGCASIDDVSYCTKASFGDTAEGGEAEAIEVDVHVEFQTPFAEPLVIEEGDAVEVNLVYDLTGVLSLTTGADSEAGRSYADGVELGFLQTPTFAFIGEPPEAEIYEVTLSGDPDPGAFPALDEWFPDYASWTTRIWLYTDGGGTPIGLANLLVAREAADRGGIELFMGGDPFAEDNGDGTYALRQGDGFETEVAFDAFEPDSHDGSVWFYDPSMWSGNGASGDGKAFDYSAVRVQ